jgi:hypothetical protein
LTQDEILTCAIEEMTRKTEIWSVKIKKKDWLSGEAIANSSICKSEEIVGTLPSTKPIF